MKECQLLSLSSNWAYLTKLILGQFKGDNKDTWNKWQNSWHTIMTNGMNNWYTFYTWFCNSTFQRWRGSFYDAMVWWRFLVGLHKGQSLCQIKGQFLCQIKGQYVSQSREETQLAISLVLISSYCFVWLCCCCFVHVFVVVACCLLVFVCFGFAMQGI